MATLRRFVAAVSSARREEAPLLEDGEGASSVMPACQRRTSLVAGTVLKGSRKPLSAWFQAMLYLKNQSDVSVSSCCRAAWLVGSRAA